MLEHVEGRDHVELLSGKGYGVGQRAGLHRGYSASRGAPACAVVHFHCAQLPIAGKESEVPAVAAAQLEQRPVAGWSQISIQHRAQYASPRREPPMFLLGLRGERVRFRCHGAAGGFLKPSSTVSTTYSGRFRVSSRMRTRYSLTIPSENSSIAPTRVSRPATVIQPGGAD